MSKFNFGSKTSVSVAALEANTGNGARDPGPAYSPENYNDLDIGEYRKSHKAETASYSDEQLYVAVMATDDDMSPEDWSTYFKANAPVMNTDSEGETQLQKALALAALESPEMEAAAVTAANAKEDWQGGPIKLLAAMLPTYGDKFEEFPKPDLETGNNPDKFKVAKQDDAGVTSIRKTSFYVEFCDRLAETKVLIQEVKFLKRIANVNDKKDGIPAELIDLYVDDEDKRDQRVKYLTTRRNTIRAAYKKAVGLYFQMDAVASLPHVGCDFDYVMKDGEETNEVENTPAPIMVWERPVEGKPIKKKVSFSIGSFLKLDPKIAAENGGTLKALLKTVARDTNTKNAEFPTIKTAETYVKALVECFRAIDEFNKDADQKEMGKLMKVLNSKDADELKVAVIEYRNYLDDICDEMKLGEWYANLQAKRDPLVTRKAKAA